VYVTPALVVAGWLDVVIAAAAGVDGWAGVADAATGFVGAEAVVGIAVGVG
jgi:hypothetical protein